jgi:hypothetical protein
MFWLTSALAVLTLGVVVRDIRSVLAKTRSLSALRAKTQEEQRAGEAFGALVRLPDAYPRKGDLVRSYMALLRRLPDATRADGNHAEWLRYERDFEGLLHDSLDELVRTSSPFRLDVVPVLRLVESQLQELENQVLAAKPEASQDNVAAKVG